MVARLVRDQEAAGSSPVTSTIVAASFWVAQEREEQTPLFFLVLLIGAPQRGLSDRKTK